MSDERYGFCPHCGHELTEDCAYCPDCGAVLGPAAAPGAQPYNAPYAGPTGKDKPMDSQFLISFILLAAYSIIMTLSAFACLFFADSTVSAMVDMLAQSGMTWNDFMSSMGLDMTQAEFVDYLKLTGAYVLVSVLPAIVSTVLCFMRRKHMIAVATAGLATLVVLCTSILSGTMLSALLDTAIGALVTYMLYKNCREYFVD